MSEKFNENEWIQVLFLYSIPILSWIIYTHQEASLEFSFLVAGSGFVILFFGSALFISLLKRQVPEPQVFAPVFESAPVVMQQQDPVFTEESILPYKEQIESIQYELGEKEREIQSMTEQLTHALREHQEIKEKLTEVMETSAQKEEEARKKIEALELESHQKMQTSKHLENQIHDLRYEIKTLLQLTEVDYTQLGMEPSKKQEVVAEAVVEPVAPMQPKGSARSRLTRCIDIAQKITAGYHSSSLRSLSLDPYAFDLRRLSDALRQEVGALILVYSPKEERILFANGETKAILGISPEQFAQDFTEIAGSDFSTWKSGVTQLLTKSEVNITVEFTTNAFGPVALNALMGPIPTGVFRSLVIAILQPL
jgi:hypothetical protein